MPEYTKAEALAFIEAIRLSLDGKVGFKWLVEKLSSLAAYVESVADENARLNAYLDTTGRQEEYRAYCQEHPHAFEAEGQG